MMASHGVPRVSAPQTVSEEARQAELKQIKEYRDLTDTVQTKINEGQFTTETLDLTTKLLIRNPEYYTIWNHRRRILLNGFFHHASSSSSSSSGPPTSDAPPAPAPPSAPPPEDHAATCLALIRSDLAFVLARLRKFPKCYWIWNHRLWLLQQARALLSKAVARQLWQEELGLVGKMLTLDSRNFHGWGYRRTVVEQLESAELAPDGGFEREGDRVGKSMVEDEFEYTTRMIKTSLSNFSAWHYRSTLIPQLLDERGADEAARGKLLDDEFEMILTALYTDSFNQSAWFYYEWLISNLSTEEPTGARPATAAKSIVPAMSVDERRRRLQREIENILEMLDGGEDCKWIYEALLRYTIMLRRMQGVEGVLWNDETAGWVAALRKLDPMRMGRWDDLERSLRDGGSAVK